MERGLRYIPDKTPFGQQHKYNDDKDIRYGQAVRY